MGLEDRVSIIDVIKNYKKKLIWELARHTQFYKLMNNRERQLTRDFLMGISLAPGCLVTGKNGKPRKQKYSKTFTRKEQTYNFNAVPVTFHLNNLNVPLYLTANDLGSFLNVDRRIMMNKQRRKLNRLA